MTYVIRVKPGVSFEVIAPGGFRILSALDETCQRVESDITISSGCDGEHSGPNDPHHRGEAYDIRTHDHPEQRKARILQELIDILGTIHFYCFLESPGTENEHIHAQVRKGMVFPPVESEGAD